MTASFVTPRPAPQARCYYPVRITEERTKAVAAHMIKLVPAWLKARLSEERVRQQEIGLANQHRCFKTTSALRRLAQNLLQERFYALFLDSTEPGAKYLQHAASTLLSSITTYEGKQFDEILSLRMANHLMVDRYVSSRAVLATSSPDGNLPDEIGLRLETTPTHLLDTEKWHRDRYILAGKLIAEVEELLLEFVEFVAGKIIDRQPNAPVNSGLPDLMTSKHWEYRESRERFIVEDHAEQRAARAQQLAQLHDVRRKGAQKLTLSRSESVLQQAFSQQKKGAEA